MARIVLRDGALADGRSDSLRIGVSVLVDGDRIAWIRPSDDERPDAAAGEVTVIDASGSTIVPGLVDSHSHLTLPGGAHWIDRAGDPPERLLAAAEQNARLLARAGVRWARDVGAPIGIDPVDGRRRALSLGIRDRWAGGDGRPRRGYPYVRAAGTWIDRAGTLPSTGSVEASTGDELIAGALRQLDDGADLVKLYLDGPEAGVAPWSVDEVRAVVSGVHARGAKVTAHSSNLAGARVGVEAGVDAIEHGMELDTDVCAEMVANGTFLVSTLTVFRSWRSFGATTTLPRFTTPEGRARGRARAERAVESVRLAHAAGVKIATGTDFGGGSARANQLAWEVESLVAAGLEPWQALGAATWRGGDLLGEPDAGVIREGGPADLVLVHGDPLSDPTALWRVWWVSWVDA
ncbi:MAG TPA: amidohydrolase family protein [Candidatus Limnocylindrales bacterium]